MGIEKAPFGRTGHQSTRVLFGAAGLSSATQAEADRVFDVIVGAGVNHIDVAATYGDAELRIRPWLERAPGQFFLATKTSERQAGDARAQLERSLERLGVDHVDLWQFHNLTDPIDWDVALSPGGALEAAVAAREEGLVRFIGVTGHGLQVAATHRRSLERSDFDSVLLPYNYLTMQSERSVAVQTIKSAAAAPWGGRPHTRAPWYAPLEEPGDIDLAVWWAMGRSGVFLNSMADMDLLPRFLSSAARFAQRPTDEEMQSLLKRRHMEPLFV